MKHLVVDGRVLEGGPSGVRAIACGVISGLRELEQEGRLQLTVAGTRDGQDAKLPRRGFMHLHLPWLALRVRADAVLIPRQARPLVSTVSCVPIFHDLGFVTLPEYYARPWKVVAANRLALASRHALAISEFAAEEVRGARRGTQVDVLPIGASHAIEWKPATDMPYLLCIAVHEPHKNLVALVNAWSRARTEGFRLVICGREGAASAAIRSAIETLGIESDISLVSGLSDVEYRNLLAGCFAYIQPSLHEGLCIPALDMAAAGVPTATADAANLAKVFGRQGADQTFDPTSTGAISEAIETLLYDGAWRARVSEWNRKNVSLTDWRDVGRAVMAAIA